ncbi:MAG TPA: cytochrome c family protein [Sphingomicrobium sp.]|nr:cytochrome c family protein [Sphingomicrobium sp.]
MSDRFTTISGWVLFAGIIALGSSIVTGEVFHSERPETMGYPIEGVEIEGAEGEAEKPIAFYLAAADAAKGEQVFKKCAACHNADPGGANALGPALYGVMGNPVAGHPGFAYSDALKSKGGSWDWETMSAWLANPKKFAPGTKMTFAGLGKPEDRANVMAFLNSRDGSPLPVPAAPAEAAADAGAGKPGAADGAQKAENEPVLTEQQAGTNPKNVGGSGAPKVSGPAGVDKH